MHETEIGALELNPIQQLGGLGLTQRRRGIGLGHLRLGLGPSILLLGFAPKQSKVDPGMNRLHQD